MPTSTSETPSPDALRSDAAAPDLVVAIPCYQAARTVGEVVRGVQAECDLPVLVIDDGCTDGAGDVAAAAGAEVLRHAGNRGKGAALQSAFAWAERRRATGVLSLDADGQHATAEVPHLIAAHRANPDALIIGVRSFDPALMPRRSRIGNRISTWWISRFAGRPHSDTQSGFRVYPRKLYEGVRFRTARFDTETELLLRAARAGVPLIEVPIATIYAAHGPAASPPVPAATTAPATENADHPPPPATHFRNFRDTLRIITLVIGSPWWKD